MLFRSTVTAETLNQWRSEFIDSVSPLPDSLAPIVQRWQRQGLHDSALPSPLRGHWNGRLKHRVLERLDAWFADMSIQRPADVVESPPARAEAEVASTERLRKLVAQAVQGMTHDELEEIRLPPAALLRIQN